MRLTFLFLILLPFFFVGSSTENVDKSTICQLELDEAKVRQFKDAIENSYWFEFFVGTSRSFFLVLDVYLHGFRDYLFIWIASLLHFLSLPFCWCHVLCSSQCWKFRWFAFMGYASLLPIYYFLNSTNSFTACYWRIYL